MFLLVWSSRIGFEQSKIYEWLERIKAIAPESPVMIVATHTDERDPNLPIDDIQSKFRKVIGHWDVSNKTRGKRLNDLRDSIAQNASALPLMGQPWPTTWFEAYNIIKDDKRKNIKASELREIMIRRLVRESDTAILGRVLHELGIILHFDSDIELADTVLLDPQWVTENISRVLEHEAIIDGLGIFRREHMEEVWKQLDADIRDRFLRLMEMFDLSYRIPDDPENKSLVVERLSLDPPLWIFALN